MSDNHPRKHRTAEHMHEREYHAQGYRAIFGVDEAGRGPMAGPLVAAAVCLPLDDLDSLVETLRGVKDSKQMTRKQRETAYDMIRDVALAWGIGEVRAQEMPAIGNMTQVTIKAMQRAIVQAQLQGDLTPDALLIDYIRLPGYDGIEQQNLVKGENQSLSIAAASVLAKVYRDNQMRAYAEQYPQYGFDQHKGYPTKAHMQALKEHGACAIHRRNYAPVQRVLVGFE